MKLYTQNTRSKTMRIRCAFFFAVFLCNRIGALQLSMVASRAPFHQSYDGTSSRNLNSSRRIASTSTKDGVTSSLVSNLAIVALKMRLKGQSYVGCDVSASSSDVLLKGEVGPVTVRGRGWQSNLGLTCRAIEATVDKCNLDMGRILTNQKLVLTTPAEGNGMVALNAFDFGNFITHPLMQLPGLPQIKGSSDKDSTLVFHKEGVSIDASDRAVIFYGTYLNEKWRFELRRGANGQQAAITTRPLGASSTSDLDSACIAAGLTQVTSKFFNDMVFELDGTFLSFRDMMVTDKGNEPSVMLSLGILVRKFPSPGLEF